ncbi:MAG: PilZ domain-containing protein [Treponema sp.]|nr:PilZ domain-containing protein [Treponema sp.]
MPQFYKETNPMDAVYFGIGLGVIIIIVVIVNLSRKRLGIGNSSFSAPRQRRAGSPGLHKLARDVGLDSAQTKMFSFVMKNDSVADPERVLQSSDLMDRHFRRAFNTIERTSRSDEETQQRLAMLFSTRNILEATTGGGVGVNTTRVIPGNTPAVLILGKDSYPIRVISSRGAYLIVENPSNAMGEPIRVERNTPVTLSFFTKSSNGFFVDSMVYGITKAPGEGQVLQVVHSNAIKRLSQRRFRRRQTVIPTEINLVRLEPGPRRHEQKMVVDKRKAVGKILDISIGGCSIQTSSGISAGVRIKIALIANRQHVVALGEVLRTNRNRSGTIMHVKFLKIPRKSLNMINALVFEYLDA